MGDEVGLQVEVPAVGPVVGVFVVVVGASVEVGALVAFEGDLVGLDVGFLVVGAFVGDFVLIVGELEGAIEAPSGVGALEGA